MLSGFELYPRWVPLNPFCNHSLSVIGRFVTETPPKSRFLYVNENPIHTNLGLLKPHYRVSIVYTPNSQISPLDPREASRDGNFQWCCSCRERTHCVVSLGRKARIRVVLHFSSRDSRASETQARVKITPRMSPFLAWGDFHARSRFARSTIPWGKMGDYS